MQVAPHSKCMVGHQNSDKGGNKISARRCDVLEVKTGLHLRGSHCL